MSHIEHLVAIRAADASAKELKKLFAQAGTAANPRGRTLAAYRVARAALRGNTGNLRLTQEILGELQAAVAGQASQLLDAAITAGYRQAEMTLSAYGLPSAARYSVVNRTALQAIEQQVASQAHTIEALLAAEIINEQAILGDGTRIGMLSPAPVLREQASWLGWALGDAFAGMVGASLAQGGATSDFYRQAIAAIDHKTTNCCLRVHAQVTTLEGEFRLDGTPRYADRLKDPPFHYYCRTSVALVHVADIEDALTQQMLRAAKAELQAQASSGKKYIHPAHARSRRK